MDTSDALRQIRSRIGPLKIEPIDSYANCSWQQPQPVTKQYALDVFEALEKKGSKLNGILVNTGNCAIRRFNSMIPLGNGNWSLFGCRCLHDRLEYGLSELSGLQQGAEVDDESLRDVVRDIAVALTGYEIEFTTKSDPECGKSPVHDQYR